MAAKATIRDLRNSFPKVRRLLEEEGEVVVTDQGIPRYRLIRFTPEPGAPAAAPKDYMSRLRKHQPRPLSRAASKALHDANRGER
jgi:antitoxin (DNA-binding transcriptional repressor) of toxin-antitoxin stability system